MSYILDALKKAAEQRDQQTPGLRRLVTPATTPPPTSSPLRIAVLAGAGALAVIALLAVWPASLPPAIVVGEPPTTAIEPPQPPVAVAAPPQPAAPRPAPARPAVVREATRPPRARAEAPRSARPTPAPTVATRAEPVPVTPTPLGVPAPGPDGAARLRLEVLVYSDVAAERMVFINGRKYKEGDTVAERARIEQIQPDGVVLSEQGRRFTLRQ